MQLDGQQRLLNEINERSMRLENAIRGTQPVWSKPESKLQRSSSSPRLKTESTTQKRTMVLKGRQSRALLDADCHSDGDNSADSAEHEKLEGVMHNRMQVLKGLVKQRRMSAAGQEMLRNA
eukprot:5671901-Prymnesium_polylepis.1